MSRPLTEYTNEELLEAVIASARHVGYPYNDILAEMNRRLLGNEAKVKALKVWTAAMVVLVVLLFVTQPTYIGPMVEPDLPTQRWPILAIGVVWLVGVIVLVVAEMRGAFRPVDPSTASGPGATIEGPPPEPPAFLLSWDWRKRH